MKKKLIQNHDSKAHLKSYVGRTFSIRKVVYVPSYNQSRTIGATPIPREELGECVFVLDESNTRACVIKASGGTIWIPKYYLHTELPSKINKNVDVLGDIISNLCSLIKCFQVHSTEAVTIQKTILCLNSISEELRVQQAGTKI